MLTITRRNGQGVYIGRHAVATIVGVDGNTIKLQVEAPTCDVVSVGGESGAEHVAAQFESERSSRPGRRSVTLDVGAGQVVRIGRGVTVRLLALDARGPRVDAKLGIEAPRHVAVSRDDFSYDDHLRFVEQREAGRR